MSLSSLSQLELSDSESGDENDSLMSWKKETTSRSHTATVNKKEDPQASNATNYQQQLNAVAPASLTVINNHESITKSEYSPLPSSRRSSISVYHEYQERHIETAVSTADVIDTHSSSNQGTVGYETHVPDEEAHASSPQGGYSEEAHISSSATISIGNASSKQEVNETPSDMSEIYDNRSFHSKHATNIDEPSNTDGMESEIYETQPPRNKSVISSASVINDELEKEEMPLATTLSSLDVDSIEAILKQPPAYQSLLYPQGQVSSVAERSCECMSKSSTSKKAEGGLSTRNERTKISSHSTYPQDDSINMDKSDLSQPKLGPNIINKDSSYSSPTSIPFNGGNIDLETVESEVRNQYSDVHRIIVLESDSSSSSESGEVNKQSYSTRKDVIHIESPRNVTHHTSNEAHMPRHKVLHQVSVNQFHEYYDDKYNEENRKFTRGTNITPRVDGEAVFRRLEGVVENFKHINGKMEALISEELDNERRVASLKEVFTDKPRLTNAYLESKCYTSKNFKPTVKNEDFRTDAYAKKLQKHIKRALMKERISQMQGVQCVLREHLERRIHNSMNDILADISRTEKTMKAIAKGNKVYAIRLCNVRNDPQSQYFINVLSQSHGQSSTVVLSRNIGLFRMTSVTPPLVDNQLMNVIAKYEKNRTAFPQLLKIMADYVSTSYCGTSQSNINCWYQNMLETTPDPHESIIQLRYMSTLTCNKGEMSLEKRGALAGCKIASLFNGRHEQLFCIENTRHVKINQLKGDRKFNFIVAPTSKQSSHGRISIFKAPLKILNSRTRDYLCVDLVTNELCFSNNDPKSSRYSPTVPAHFEIIPSYKI